MGTLLLLCHRALLNLENGNTLGIRVMNQGPAKVVVQKEELNGRMIDPRYLLHDELIAGGEVLFFMGPRPADQMIGAEHAISH